MMNIYKERTEEIRKLMAREGIDLYYIPMDDCHMSEYVDDHFRCIYFVSGFSGSAAQVLISASRAFLFTDGRYFIQAERELEGSGIELMKEGNEGVPSVGGLARTLVEDGAVLGFDGRVVNAALAQTLVKETGKKISIRSDLDLAGEIWQDRPAQEFSDIWEFKPQYAGESTASKLGRIRAELSRKAKGSGGSFRYIVSSLDDIAWIFNIRAGDIPCNPVAYAYALITPEDAVLFANGNIGEELSKNLRSQGVTFGPYGSSNICAGAKEGETVFLDKARTGYNIYKYFTDAECDVRDIKDPSTFMKALKNETEIKNTKDAYIKDSISVIRFMKWIKDLAAQTRPGEEIKENGTVVGELEVDEKLQELRRMNVDYLGPSFDTIAAYGQNAAMMHYQAAPGSSDVLKARGMLLVDSGGQYAGATTDITRTFVLGELTEEEKKSFTLTAMAMLRLMEAKFIKGCTGENLDIIARACMWENALDYKCGTGHGVGCCLNVHEPPHRIRWKITDGRKAPLTEGMFVTDEPGVYKENRFGVRLENELVVRPYMESEDGVFLQFENMTFIPIDPDGIDLRYMSSEDRELFKKYNALVYEKTSPYMEEELAAWLKGVCGV